MTKRSERLLIARRSVYAHRPMRHGLAIALAALLALPATATAATGEQAGLELGAQAWGKPACGTPKVEVATPDEYEERHGTGVFDVEPEAWADEDRCVIVINRRTRIRTQAKRCHVIVHEWGHLAGREHTDRGVMREIDTVTEGRVRVRERKRWVWEWRASGAYRPCYEYTEPGFVIG